MWEFVTASVATSGHQAQSAANRWSMPRRRIPTSSITVVPTLSRRPVSCRGQYSASGPVTARTPAKKISAAGG